MNANQEQNKALQAAHSEQEFNINYWISSFDVKNRINGLLFTILPENMTIKDVDILSECMFESIVGYVELKNQKKE